MVYADNAATTKLDKNAFEAMIPFLTEDYGNASQPYSFSRRAKNALKEARNTIANCIGASFEEIFFTSGGTESDNWAIKGSAFLNDEKNTTITSIIEHHAVLRSCAFIESLGHPVAYLPVTGEGIVTPQSLKSIMTDCTSLVSIMFANNEIGSIQPIKELTQVAHDYGAVFHTDAVQAVGHIPINVSDLGVDMLSASAHKFNGPKGIGFLYIKKGTALSPYQNGGAQEMGLRAGTENIAAIIGMAAALAVNCAQEEKTISRLRNFESIIIEKLNQGKIDYKRNGSSDCIPGNLSLSFKGRDGEALLHRLDLMKICVSTGSACDNVNTQVSHVLRAIKLPKEYIHGTIRISLGRDNSEDDAIKIASALLKIL